MRRHDDNAVTIVGCFLLMKVNGSYIVIVVLSTYYMILYNYTVVMHGISWIATIFFILVFACRNNMCFHSVQVCTVGRCRIMILWRVDVLLSIKSWNLVLLTQPILNVTSILDFDYVTPVYLFNGRIIYDLKVTSIKILRLYCVGFPTKCNL